MLIGKGKSKQEINFIEKLTQGEDVNDNAIMFFIIKAAKIGLNNMP